MLQEDRDAVPHGLEIIPLEDEAFAVTPGAGILFHLNATARAVLEATQAGASREDIARSLAVAGSLPTASAARVVDDLLDQIARDSRATQNAAGEPLSWSPLPAPVAEASYRLFDHLVRVRFPDQEVAAACHPLLAPMEEPETARYDLAATFERIGDVLQVHCGVAQVTMHDTPQAAWSGLQRAILCHDIVDPGLFTVVLHAGAIVGPKGAWLIGGNSGQGKSTLVARLDAAGYRVLGDDLIPLDLPRGRTLPLPTALSIKESGWPIVSGFRADIERARPFETPIGKRVRYLAPRNPPRDSDRRGHEIAGLLLVNRTAGAAPEIRPLSLKQAMIAMCDRFGRFPIEPENLRQLIALFSGAPRYELIYDDAAQILPDLAKLL